jgi:hypothetical protein
MPLAGKSLVPNSLNEGLHAGFFLLGHRVHDGVERRPFDRGNSTIDFSRMNQDQQKAFLRAYCNQNPPRQYIQAVAALLGELKGATKLERPRADIPPPTPLPAGTSFNPNSLAGQLARPWRHVGEPATEAKAQQDQAKCRLMGQMAPVGAGTPEIKSMAVFIECLKSEGYQPE